MINVPPHGKGARAGSWAAARNVVYRGGNPPDPISASNVERPYEPCAAGVYADRRAANARAPRRPGPHDRRRRPPAPIPRCNPVSWAALTIIALALGAGALCKGATGVGLPLVALPILAVFLGVHEAVAILTVPIIATNAWQVWRHRDRNGAVGFLLPMALTGAVGVALGTTFLRVVPARGLALTLGVLLAVYIVLRLTRPALAMSEPKARRAAAGTGLLAGALQGASGLSGPVLLSFFHALHLPRESYIFSISLVYSSLSLAHVPALAVAGLYSWTTLMLGLFALLPVVLLMPVGMWLGRHLSQAVFDRIILVIMAVMSLRLIQQGLTG